MAFMFRLRHLLAWCAAALIGLAAALCVWPVILALLGAVWQDGAVTAAPLMAAFADGARIRMLAWNTIRVMAGAAGLALAPGLPLGFLIFRTDLPMREWLGVGCVVGACVPLYVVATSWMALFGMHAWLSNVWGAAWITGVAMLPLATLLAGAFFLASDRDLEELALLERGWPGLIIYAVLRPAMLALAAGIAVIMVLSVWDITVTDILVIRTFGEEVYTQFQLGAGAPRASALALPMLAVTLPAGLFAWRMARREGGPSFWGRAARPRVFKLGAWRWIMLAFVAGAAALFAIPFVAILKALGGPANFVTAWRVSRRELLETLIEAPVAATCCVALALPLAWVILRCRRMGRAVAFAALLLLCVPAPVVGIGIIEALNRAGPAGLFYDSPAVLVLAHVIRSLPFAMLVLLPALLRVPVELEESAQLDGATWLERLFRVAAPSIPSALGAAWALALVLSLSELGASCLVVPPGYSTLSIRFFTLIHYGVYPDAAGLCLILLCCVGLAAFFLAWMARPLFRRGAWLLLLGMAALAMGCAAPRESGHFDHVIGAPGHTAGRFHRPRGLVYHPGEDALFVVDWDGRIQKFDPDGAFRASWVMPDVEKGKPEDLCVGLDGTLFVADTHYSRIVEFAPDGRQVGTFGTYGKGPGQFIYPVGICRDSKGNLYVSEYGENDRIQKFDCHGRFLKQWGTFGREPGNFQRPSGLVCTDDDLVVVADAVNHRLQVFDSEGALLKIIGREGTGPGEFRYPYDVAAAGDCLYVLEFGNQRVQKITRDGKPLGAAGRPGKGDGCFASPWRCAVMKGGLYVSDTDNGRVVRVAGL